MKLTKKQINQIREHTPKEIIGNTHFVSIEHFGYFQPYDANWAYIAQWVRIAEQEYLVVTLFGEVLGK